MASIKTISKGKLEDLERNLLPFKTKDQELLKNSKKWKLNKYRISLSLIDSSLNTIIVVGFDFTKKNSIKI